MREKKLACLLALEDDSLMGQSWQKWNVGWGWFVNRFPSSNGGGKLIVTSNLERG